MEKSAERLRDYETIDQHIEAGHAYAGIVLALGYAKDEFQRKDMEATAKALFESSGYIRDAVEHHPDYLSFLASRGGARDMVQPRILQERGDERDIHSIGGEVRRDGLHLCLEVA